MDPILVVIDMQPTFSASQNKQLIENLVKEIDRFKSRNWPILVVEYDWGGSECPQPADYRTDYRIALALGTYYKAWYIKKSTDDGGKEVAKFARNRYGTCDGAVFHVTGVNASACVIATIRGLGTELPNSKIVALSDCCADWGGHFTYLDTPPCEYPPNAVFMRQTEVDADLAVVA